MKRNKIGRNNIHSRRNKGCKATSNVLGKGEKDDGTSSAKMSFFRSVFHFFIKIVTLFFPHFRQTKTDHTSSFEVQNLKEKIEKLEKNIEKLTRQFNKAQKKMNKEKSVTDVKENVQPSMLIPPPPSTMCIPPPPTFNSVNIPKPPKATQILSMKPRGFSLADLKSVQLKSTNNNTLEKCKRKETGGRQVVSLKDIQNVKLKSRRVKSDENENIVKHLPAKPCLSSVLKKTNVVRSPGGTPLVKRDTNLSTATGLTPAFTRALHNKFRSVKVSPISNSDESSPHKWRC